MSQVPDNSWEHALEYVRKEFPDAVGTTPQWPRFDVFKAGYAAGSEESILLGQAVAACDLNGVVTQIGKTISGLMRLSVVLGVDMRPVMAALHAAEMSGGTADIATLLSLQAPLQAPVD